VAAAAAARVELKDRMRKVVWPRARGMPACARFNRERFRCVHVPNSKRGPYLRMV